MRKARFDTQLLSVFAILVALTVMVGAVAITVNWYLIRTHDEIIDRNLPARELAAQIGTQSGLMVPLIDGLARAETDTETARIATTLAALIAEIEAGLVRLAGAQGAPVADEAPADILARVVATAADATALHRELIAGQQRIDGAGARLEDIISAQVDLARLRMTAGLSALYEAPQTRPDPRIDALADRYFFAFDRLAELVRMVDALRLQALRAADPVTAAEIDQRRTFIANAHDLALRRAQYLPGLSARREVIDLLGRFGETAQPGGALDQRLRLEQLRAALAADEDRLRAHVATLAKAAGSLRDAAQSESLADIARADLFIARLTAALVVFISAALVVASLLWIYARKRLVKRLGTVAERIVAVAEGDFATRVPISGHDEIGRVEKAINILRRRAAEAARLRDHLEEAVLTRTTDVLREMQASDAARIEAEEANRKQTQFLARMSHEIRTPLNGMIGMLQLLHQEAAPGSGQRRIAVALASARDLLEITNDILTFTAAQDPAARRNAVHFNLRTLIGQLGQQLQSLGQAKGLETVIDLPQDAPPVLLGDVVKIRQVLTNLISNAVKYTARGNVSLVVDHAPGPGPDTVILGFTVSDTGMGLDRDTLARAFDVYNRSDAARRAGTEGMGLGLAISRQLTEAMGGGLHVESEPGLGSRFTLTVPLGIGDPGQIMAAEPTGVPGDQFDLSVLVIEDHPVNRMVARGLLEKLGCTVTEAEDGGTGLRLAKAARFDLALIDLDLPDMPGTKVAAGLARLPDPPALAALTAHLIADTPAERARLGMQAILAKPVSPRALMALLHTITPVGATPAPPPVPEAPPNAQDNPTLAALRSDLETLGEATMTEIVQTFLDDLPAALTRLQAETGTGRARAAHKLKGAAANFGMEPLCAILAAIEAAPDDLPADIADTVHTAGARLRAAARALGLQLSEGTSR
ncbi:ATP-binding protein [Pontitalea aquivivens]|uniref:ATP-binding protein n=1 Tax=Pontitalea aquivivens TaxID=3388663 RepID=UPI003970AF49